MANFFAIKGKVVSILRENLEDFEITWGFTTRNPPRTWCYIGRLHWPDGEWATNRSREYRVTLPIILNAIRIRETPEQAEDWLAARVETVIDTFGAASGLRDVGVITWTLVPRDFGSQPHPEGGIEVQSALELQVTYRP